MPVTLPNSQGQGEQSKADRNEAIMQGYVTQPAIQLNPVGGQSVNGRGAQVPPDFPAKLIPRDSYDAVYQEKMDQMHQTHNMYGKEPNVVMHMTDQDMDYIQRKRNVQNKLQFDKWMTTAIDLSDPTQGKSGGGAARGKPRPHAQKPKHKPKPKLIRSGIGKAKRSTRGLLRNKAGGHRRGARN